jgi:DNA replication and repair protein RecF
VRLVRLQTESFRNLGEEPFVWVGGLNLVLGENGEGKSNLLEAVAVLGTMRSFRGAAWGAVVRHGRGSLRLSGRLEVNGLQRDLEQVVDLGPPIRRRVRIDGREVGAADYLQWFPVFAMSPTDAGLVGGGPEARRALLDRLAFLLQPSHLTNLRNFRRALRQRNAALGGVTVEDELASWEERLGELAARVVATRLETMPRLERSFQAVYAQLGLGRSGFPAVGLRYRVERWLDRAAGWNDLAQAYRARFAALRRRDRELGFTSEGPHRHDLVLGVDGRPARTVLSAGQARAVASALRLAALAEVERERGEALPVVVDDADAELDARGLAQLLDALGPDRQVFLSSAHDEVAARVPAVRTVWVRGGKICRAHPVEMAHE